jgi:hypothetical protein
MRVSCKAFDAGDLDAKQFARRDLDWQPTGTISHRGIAIAAVPFVSFFQGRQFKTGPVPPIAQPDTASAENSQHRILFARW